MIQLSHKILTFDPIEKYTNFTITNISKLPIIYKIKTNCYNSISVSPVNGYINVGANTQIQATLKRTNKKGLKLQINCIQCPDGYKKENFAQLWERYQKYRQSYLINIEINSSDGERKREEGLMSQSQMISVFHSMQMKKSGSLAYSINSSQKYSDLEMNSYENEKRGNKLKIMKEKVSTFQTINKKLADEQKKAQKILNQARHLKPVYFQEHYEPCNEIHLSKTLLFLFVVFVFCFGYLIAKNHFGKS